MAARESRGLAIPAAAAAVGVLPLRPAEPPVLAATAASLAAAAAEPAQAAQDIPAGPVAPERGARFGLSSMLDDDALPVSGYGKRALGATIAFLFTTSLNGNPTDLAGSPAVSVYISGTTAPITTGVTFTQTYNSTVGLNSVSIVASAGNGYSAPNDYEVVITTGTLAGVSMVGCVVGRFSLV
jgi:hypothetical protein